jgi:polyisoprenoid-binding protein YceI
MWAESINRRWVVRGLAVALVAAPLAAPPAFARSAWTIEPQKTRIAFAIDAVGYPRTNGSFRDFAGRITVDFDQPGASRVAFEVAAASVDLGSSAFSDYVRSPVLLDAENHPKIGFTSTAVEKLDDHRVRVVGDLTLLGKTQPLTVDVEVERKPGPRARLGFVARARIDRLAYGMNSGWPLISGDVDLVVTTEAVEP